MSEPLQPSPYQNVQRLLEVGIHGFAAAYDSPEYAKEALQAAYDHCWQTVYSSVFEDAPNTQLPPEEEIVRIAGTVWKTKDNPDIRNYTKLACVLRWQRTEPKENETIIGSLQPSITEEDIELKFARLCTEGRVRRLGFTTEETGRLLVNYTVTMILTRMLMPDRDHDMTDQDFIIGIRTILDSRTAN